MLFDLNDDNFMIYCAKNYDRQSIIQSEFIADIHRIKYIKRLINKYKQTGELKERMILNHIIILSNCFGIQPTVNMLFLKLDPEIYPILKTFLLYLNYLPEHLTVTFNKYYIRQQEISVDLAVAEKLRNI